jgi:carbamoyl-phosphate synthase large subunit
MTSNSRDYNVLVTGCGGDIGQSISKILRLYPLIDKIIGTDIHENHPGKFLCDQFQILPRCTSDNFLESLEETIKSNSIDFVISASEPELRFYASNKINKAIFGKPLIMANQKALDVGFDKLETAKFLETAGLPFPKTEVVKNVKAAAFPGILKSRAGSGSKQLFVIGSPDDFDFYKKKFPDFIMQEFLGDDSKEYTCGLFRSKSGQSRHIIFHRTLSGGFSNFGIVEKNESISALLNAIAVKLDLVGSINVQLKLCSKGPVVFEINPRFSSTVLFRDLLGFKDLIWSIEDALNRPLSDYSDVPLGRKFYKGYHEYYE